MLVKKISANSTGLSFAVEASLGILPATPVWLPLEPNSYKTFGPTIKKTARNPINSGRQNKFGVATDQDVNGGYQADLTYTSIQAFAPGLFYANYRAKNDISCSSVDATAGYEPGAGGAGFHANDLVFGSGFANAANNGYHTVTGNPANNSVEFAGSVTEANAINGAITRVGVVCAAGDITVDPTGPLPVLRSTAYNFTELGCIPGEWIYIGDDPANTSFANAANNGFARVNNVAQNVLTLDKTQNTMVADAGAGVTLHIFVGRVIKNESSPTLQVRRTYTFERTLGAPDDSAPGNLQAEYLYGCGFNEYVLTFNTADKVTGEVTLVGANYVTNSATQGLLPGTRPPITDAVTYNTTSHVVRSALTPLPGQTGSGSTLFAYLSVAALTVNNGIKPNKALGVFGAFDFNTSNFVVSATATAYFQNVAALNAVKNNTPTSFDLILAENNRGMAFDVPLVSLGETGLNVASDQAVLVPLTMEAADAEAYLPQMPHTLMVTFFDYLPTAAMPVI